MDLPALEVKQPVIDPMAASQVSRAADTQNRSEVLRQTAANLEMLASGMAYAMPEGPDGPLDEAKLEEVIGSYGAAGMDPAMLAKILENPEAARVIYRSSATALKVARDEKLFPLELQKMQAEINKAMQEPAPDLNTDQENLAQINAERKAAGKPAQSMEEYLAGKKPPGTTVNVGPNGQDYGDPGEGLVWKRDAAGEIVIDDRGAPIAITYQGGERYAEEQAALKAGENKDERTNLKAGIVIQDTDRALELIQSAQLPTTGLVGDWLKDIGGTEAADVQELLASVKANAGFSELQAMREASPTGAALGNVTEKELAFLQATIGSLSQKQSAGQLLDNIKRVKNAYLDIVHGEGKGPPREKLSFDEGAGVPDDATETKVLGGKTYYKGADGSWYEAD